MTQYVIQSVTKDRWMGYGMQWVSDIRDAQPFPSMIHAIRFATSELMLDVNTFTVETV